MYMCMYVHVCVCMHYFMSLLFCMQLWMDERMRECDELGERLVETHTHTHPLQMCFHIAHIHTGLNHMYIHIYVDTNTA